MINKKDSNPKDAIGCKKPPLSVLPMPVLFEVGAGMLEGACKYRRHNYRAVGVRASIYFDAAMRHLALWWEGEDIDQDSGLHHITKAIAGLIVLRDAQMRDMVNDDRPPRFDNDPGRVKWMQIMQERVDEVLAKYPEPLPPYTELGDESLEVPPVDGDAVKLIFDIRKTETETPTQVLSEIAVSDLRVGDIFTSKEGTFKVTNHFPRRNTIHAVERLDGGSYADEPWSFPRHYRVEFKGAGK